jgi:hypothetical protein
MVNQITDPGEQLFAAQAEFRKGQAALRRAHEILNDTAVDGTHSLKLALEQQIRAIQRMADMLKKVGTAWGRRRMDEPAAKWRNSPPGMRAVAAPVDEVVDVAEFALQNARRCAHIRHSSQRESSGCRSALPLRCAAPRAGAAGMM